MSAGAWSRPLSPGWPPAWARCRSCSCASCPRRAYDGILGLGAGLMLAAATLGLLGEARARRRAATARSTWAASRWWSPASSSASGVAAVDGPLHPAPPRRAATTSTSATSRGTTSTIATSDEADDRDARRGYAIVGALTLHRIPEGLAIGAGFAVPGSSHLGLLLAIAVGVQNACEGLVMAAPLRQGGVSARRGFVIVALTGLAIPLAAVVGRALAGAGRRGDAVHPGAGGRHAHLHHVERDHPRVAQPRPRGHRLGGRGGWDSC